MNQFVGSNHLSFYILEKVEKKMKPKFQTKKYQKSVFVRKTAGDEKILGVIKKRGKNNKVWNEATNIEKLEKEF